MMAAKLNHAWGQFPTEKANLNLGEVAEKPLAIHEALRNLRHGGQIDVGG
jgi:hypothetical protein